MNIEERIVEELTEIFDGLAKPTLDVQKKKLGIERELTPEEYKMLIKEIRNACSHMVGDNLAEEVYAKLERIIEEG